MTDAACARLDQNTEFSLKTVIWASKGYEEGCGEVLKSPQGCGDSFVDGELFTARARRHDGFALFCSICDIHERRQDSGFQRAWESVWATNWPTFYTLGFSGRRASSGYRGIFLGWARGTTRKVEQSGAKFGMSLTSARRTVCSSVPPSNESEVARSTPRT